VGWDRSRDGLAPEVFAAAEPFAVGTVAAPVAFAVIFLGVVGVVNVVAGGVIPVAVVALAFLRIVGEALDDILRGRVARFHAVDPDLGTRRGAGRRRGR